MKFIFFGDSLTWGGYGGNWVAEIAHHCTDHEIINAGVGGNTVVNLLRRVGADVIDQEPDGVFVMVGGNDAISYDQPQTRPYYKKSQSIPDGVVSPETFASAYRNLLTQLQLAHIQTWVGLPPSEHSASVAAATHQYNDIATGVARSLNIPVLDLMAQFSPDDIPERGPITLDFINQIGQRAISGWDDYANARIAGGFTYTFDGMHLLPETAQDFAKAITAFLNLC